MSRKKKNKGGRREGSKNRDYDRVDWYPPHCRNCGSTEKSTNKKAWEIPCTGIDPNGRAFNVKVTRRVECAHCGQWRFESSYEFRPIESAAPVQEEATVEAATSG